MDVESHDTTFMQEYSNILRARIVRGSGPAIMVVILLLCRICKRVSTDVSHFNLYVFSQKRVYRYQILNFSHNYFENFILFHYLIVKITLKLPSFFKLSLIQSSQLIVQVYCCQACGNLRLQPRSDRKLFTPVPGKGTSGTH